MLTCRQEFKDGQLVSATIKGTRLDGGCDTFIIEAVGEVARLVLVMTSEAHEIFCIDFYRQLSRRE
jgi:hypothetical protein